MYGILVMMDKEISVLDRKTQGSKYTMIQRQEICDRIVEYVRHGRSESQACSMVKIPRSTLFNWKREDEKFNRELKLVRNEESLTLAQQNIQLMLKSKNPVVMEKATLFVLKHYDEDASTKIKSTNTNLDIHKAHEALKKMHRQKPLEELDKMAGGGVPSVKEQDIELDQGI